MMNVYLNTDNNTMVLPMDKFDLNVFNGTTATVRRKTNDMDIVTASKRFDLIEMLGIKSTEVNVIKCHYADRLSLSSPIVNENGNQVPGNIEMLMRF